VAQGLGLPALFNDNVIIPALVAHGVSPEDAIGYGIVGCVEACVPGKQQGLTAGGHINVAKAWSWPSTRALHGLGRTDWLAYPALRHSVGSTTCGKPMPIKLEYLASLNILATLIAGEGQKRRGIVL